MKKLSKKMIEKAVDSFGKEDICKFFMERCQEAALDAAKCARGNREAERNLLISIATIMAWGPLAVAAVGGEYLDADGLFEDACEKAQSVLTSEDGWLLDAYDNGSGSIYGD